MQHVVYSMQHCRCVALFPRRRCCLGVKTAVSIVTTLLGSLVRRFRTNHEQGPGAETEVTTTAGVCDGLVCDVGTPSELHYS